MTISELLNKLDEYNDSYEDLYNKALHELTENDGDFTIKQFLESLLEDQEED